MAKESNLFDLDIEKYVIGAIIKAPELLFEVDHFLNSDDFSKENGQVFSIIKCLICEKNIKSINDISILNCAKELKLKISSGVIEELCSNSYNKFDNFRTMSLKTKQLSLKRQLRVILGTAEKTILNDGSSVSKTLDSIESEIFGFSNNLNENRKLVRLGDKFLDYANDRANNPVDIIGLPTSYSLYSEAVGGLFRRGSVNIIAARAKSGKSFYAQNLAYDQANRNIPTLLIDTELRESDQFVRLGSLDSGVSSEVIEKGQWVCSNDTKDAIIKTGSSLKKLPLYYVSMAGENIDAGVGHIRDFLNRIVRRNKKGQFNDCAIFYDYLKIDDPDAMKGNIQEHHAIMFSIKKLRDLALIYDIPLFVFVQSNRSGLRVFDESAIAMSDRLSWLCTSLAILAKKTKEEIDEMGVHFGTRKLYVVLSHHGAGLNEGDFIHLKEDFSVSKISEVKLESERVSSVQKKIDANRIKRKQNNIIEKEQNH